MSTDYTLDEGMKDEARVANSFVRLGCFTRPHVQIYPSEMTQKVGDIDVFAIKFDRYLNRCVSLVEVKKNSNRIVDLFKLYGFKTYYGNCDTYFVSDRIAATFLDIAKSLGIRTISSTKLREMSQLEGVEVEEEFTDRDIVSIDKFLRTIRDEFDQEIFWKYNYQWLERNPYTRFFHIQRLFIRTKLVPEKLKTEILWLRKELFLIAFLAFLDMTSDCTNVDTERIDQYVQGKFYGIGTPKEAKLKIKQGVDNILSILKGVSGAQTQNLELPSIEVIPAYLKDLISLVKDSVRNARFLNKYLLLNDLVYRAYLHGKPKNVNAVVKSDAQASGLKTTNDLLLRILHDGPIMPDFSVFV